METDLNFILRHEYMLSGRMRDFLYSIHPMKDNDPTPYTEAERESIYKIKQYIYAQLKRDEQKQIYDEQRRLYIDRDGQVREAYDNGTESKPIAKIIIKHPQIIKTKINYTTSLGEANHPITDKIFAKAGESLRKFEEMVFNHFQELEEEFPNHTGFYYEVVKEDYSCYYNLMAKEK